MRRLLGNKSVKKLNKWLGRPMRPDPEPVVLVSIASYPPRSPSLLAPGLTTDPDDPRLVRGIDPDVVGQHPVYLVLPDEERAKGFVRPVRRSYRHAVCGAVTTMGLQLAETYARDPHFYGGTYCAQCRTHFPVAQFTWVEGGEVVGT